MDVPLFVGTFVAGMLMFLAPCTLPIVPGYLAFIAGIPLSALQNPAAKKSARRAVIKNAFAFVIGFSLVFIALGAAAGLLGVLAGPWRFALSRLGGAVIIVFGLTMLNIVPLSFLLRERHVRLPAFLELGRLSSSAFIGALFALGWSPCIGPILGTVTAVLVSETTAFLTRLSGLVRALTLIGGISLVVTGVLMVTGIMDTLVAGGYAMLGGWGYDALLNYL